MSRHFITQWGMHRERAVVAVQVSVVMVVLIGFAALTIDVGALYNARADLQRAADAAALAGTSSYTSDDMIRVRTEVGGTEALAAVINEARTRVGLYSASNPTLGLSTTLVDQGDILTGWMNADSTSETIHTNPVPIDYNAVQVTVRRAAGESLASNGPVNFYFASIWGKYFGETSASATALFDDRFSGYSVSTGEAGMLPFTIDEDAFLSELAAGGDSYGYDENTGLVTPGADDIREIRLYPYPLSGSGYEEGDGNFGVLNIGTGNQGVDAEVIQIQNGITPEDFVAEIGTSDLTFFDESGNSLSYDITGSPGLEVALQTPITELIGQTVGFFLHNNVVLSGSNAIYTITQMRFGRVMDIRLTGAPNQRGLFVQPTSYAGPGVMIHEFAPSSNGAAGRIVLVR
ncbi:MAG: hypothetical protein JSU63_03615 [Phycisphaerales bacterium]|nr:MAG: hypothetical protein JSU63_03615 [Phycisphaerales bacterium]